MAISARLTARYVPPAGVEEQAAMLAAPRMDRLGDRIVANAKRRCPVRTGNLRSSITHQTTIEGNRVRLSVSANARYARFVEYGTRPHVIRARRSPVLSFFWPKVGRQVFFKQVNHPGSAGRFFLTHAVNDELGHPI